MAIRIPISLVRSVTETSMMFMIPMPPTRSDTDAIAASRYCMTFVCSSAACINWVRFLTEKSSSFFAPVWCSV